MYGYARFDKDLWVSNSALLVPAEPLGSFGGLNLNAYVFGRVNHPGTWESYTTTGDLGANDSGESDFLYTP